MSERENLETWVRRVSVELEGWADLRSTRNGAEDSQLFGEGRQARAGENCLVSGVAPWYGALVPCLALSLEKVLL